MFDHGLDPKLKGQGGVTLLHLASHFGRVLVAKMLLQAGADPTARDDRGKTPKDVAVDAAMSSLLQNAITEGPPPPTPPDVFEIGEQAYCLDKHGHWWPAIIEQVHEGGWYGQRKFFHFILLFLFDILSFPKGTLFISLALVREMM